MMLTRSMLVIQTITWNTKGVFTLLAQLSCNRFSTYTTVSIRGNLGMRTPTCLGLVNTIFSIFIFRISFTFSIPFRNLLFNCGLFFMLKKSKNYMIGQKKLAQPSQPIKCNINTYPNLVTHVFLCFKQVACFYFEFSLFNDDVNFFLIGLCGNFKF